MYKSKTRLIVVLAIMLVIYTMFLGYVYAKNSEISDNWKVTITSDAKELSEVREIKFKVKENKNVVSGKIAPGLTAVSKIDVDLEKINGKVDINVLADSSELYDEKFVLKAYIDGEEYNFGEIQTVDSGRIVEITLEIEWLDSSRNDNQIDTQIGEKIESLKIPISVRVSQNV